ncbi:HprK-related kinase B [Roseibium polysiphoniae]|uniref:HprK-related kinase B n=1 Tax=Roseibium polysiphoniae TaxID=2571221 RepID=A0ABR9CBV3_9HYPH|nr:HprK-related kinase B [Roseibium polysiphoniae]MBD8877093.1 HprK-related kinase B [Roseibium polysiphoniae]
MSELSSQDVNDALQPQGRCSAHSPIHLKVGSVVVEIRSNSEPVLSELRQYFLHAVVPDEDPTLTVYVLDDLDLPFDVAWSDWAREPGKAGRKDAISDLPNARLVRKVRTGMTFLQSTDWKIAFGPCKAYPNQVVNFVNTQILNHFQQLGWVGCHAAAVNCGERTLAIAGLSGGGKSTTMLKLMELDGGRYVTNDRLLVGSNTPHPDALGIPKLPRINPGTILHNPRLRSMLSATKQAELEALTDEELWTLEEKHDLMVGDVFGPDRIRHAASLTHFWVLNWSRETDEPTNVRDVKIEDRPDLLAAIMKSPGPFYQRPNGSFWQDDSPLEPEAYLAALKGVEVQEVSGQIDFDVLFQYGEKLFGARA